MTDPLPKPATSLSGKKRKPKEMIPGLVISSGTLVLRDIRQNNGNPTKDQLHSHKHIGSPTEKRRERGADAVEVVGTTIVTRAVGTDSVKTRRISRQSLSPSSPPPPSLPPSSPPPLLSLSPSSPPPHQREQQLLSKQRQLTLEAPSDPHFHDTKFSHFSRMPLLDSIQARCMLDGAFSDSVYNTDILRKGLKLAPIIYLAHLTKHTLEYPAPCVKCSGAILDYIQSSKSYLFYAFQYKKCFKIHLDYSNFRLLNPSLTELLFLPRIEDLKIEDIPSLEDELLQQLPSNQVVGKRIEIDPSYFVWDSTFRPPTGNQPFLAHVLQYSTHSRTHLIKTTIGRKRASMYLLPHACKIVHPTETSRAVITDHVPSKSRENYCVFCERPGTIRQCEGILNGPFRCKDGRAFYAHSLCYVWSEYFGTENDLDNKMVLETLEKSIRKICVVCDKAGASLVCYTCKVHAHFRCALKKHFGFTNDYGVYCHKHKHEPNEGDDWYSIYKGGKNHLLPECNSCEFPSYDMRDGRRGLLVCSSCNCACHIGCAEKVTEQNPDHPATEDEDQWDIFQITTDWLCEPCSQCLYCRKSVLRLQANLICCTVCNKLYHTSCVQAAGDPLEDIVSWKCRNCFTCRHCGTSTSAKWDENGKSCAACYDRYRKGFFCSICDLVYPLGCDSMAFCDSCQMWLHSKCIESLDPTFDLASVGRWKKKDYSCPKCLAQNKEHHPSIELQDKSLLSTGQLHETKIYSPVEICQYGVQKLTLLPTHAEICKACGGFGNASDFRFCFDCGDSWHRHCIDYNIEDYGINDIDLSFSDSRVPLRLRMRRIASFIPWRCRQCYRCQVCKKDISYQVSSSVQCENCRHTFHKACVGIHQKFKVQDYCCDHCSKCDICFVPGAKKAPDNYCYCKRCASTLPDHNPCGICHKAWPPEDNLSHSLSLFCADCGSIVHSKCDKNVLAVHRLLKDNEEVDFICSVCTKGTRAPFEGKVSLQSIKDSLLVDNRKNTVRFFDQVETTKGFRFFPKNFLLRTINNLEEGSTEKLIKNTDEMCLTVPNLMYSRDVFQEAVDKGPSEMSVDEKQHVCCSCLGNDDALGYLRPLTLQKWIHSKCLLAGCDLDQDNDYIDQSLLLLNLKDMCNFCNQPGALLSCQECTKCFHYPCAIQQGCFLSQRGEIFCKKHIPSSAISQTNLAESGRKFPKQVFFHQLFDISELDQFDRWGLRIGTLTIFHFGFIIPENQNFHNEDVIIPYAFQSSRIHWSTVQRGKRCSYHFEILKNESNAPVYSIKASDDGVSLTETSIDDAWKKVQEMMISCQGWKIVDGEELRSSGKDAIGLTNPHVIPILERMPRAVQLFKYRFQTNDAKHAYPRPKVVNPSGCARTEAYHRKNQGEVRHFPANTAEEPGDQTRKGKNKNNTADEVLKLDVPFSTQHRTMQSKLKQRIKLARSKIEGWGIYALEEIEPYEMVIEYVGQVIRPALSDLREEFYDRTGAGCYLFRIDYDGIVDATKRANKARFINHSCDPNCFSRVVTVEKNRKAICIFSKRRIFPGEELTYDYHFSTDGDEKVLCTCASKNCRGFMN